MASFMRIGDHDPSWPNVSIAEYAPEISGSHASTDGRGCALSVAVGFAESFALVHLCKHPKTAHVWKCQSQRISE